VFILDSLLIGGIRFVLDKVAAAAEQELNDDDALRQQLLDAQMRVELGEMSEKEFAAVETDILARLREIRERREGDPLRPGEFKVTGVEAEFEGDERK
jgi:hypothetical protein